MPNWVTNRIILHNADQKEIDKVIGFLRSKDSEVDFNNIIPMPDELKKTTSGTRSDYAWAYYQARGLGDFAEIDKMLGYAWVKREGIKTRDDLLDSLLDSHIECCKYDNPSERLFEGYEDIYKYGEWLYNLDKKYGYHEWYTWSCENWGTKWNACDARREGNILIFETPWDGVPRLMLMVSDKFPQVVMDYEFADEDFGYNTARYTFVGGEVITE